MNIILFFTNMCNFRCEHCYLGDLLDKKREYMDQDLFDRIMVLHNYFDAEKLIFSGGEPMLLLDEIYAYIKRNKYSCNIPKVLCTNGYWGRDLNVQKIVWDLKSLYFTKIELSVDGYHQKFAGIDECIIPIIRTANDCNMHVTVTICFKSIPEALPSIVKVSKVIKRREDIILRPISKFGNAEKFNVSSDFSLYKKPRCTNLGNLCVDYNGNAFICCGPPIVSKNPNYSLGNVRLISNDLVHRNYMIRLLRAQRVIDGLRNLHTNEDYCSACINQMESTVCQ